MTLSYIWYFYTARILCKWPTIWRSSVNDRWRRFFFSKNPLRWTWRLCNILCLWSWKYVTSRTYVSRSRQIVNIHSLKFNVLKHTKLKTTQTRKTIINKKCIKNMRHAFELRWLYRQGHRNQTQTTFNNLPIVLRLSKSNADISLIRSCIWFLSFLFLSIDLSDILAVRALFDLNVYRTETGFVSVHHQIRFFPTSIYVKSYEEGVCTIFGGRTKSYYVVCGTVGGGNEGPLRLVVKVAIAHL